VDSNLELCEQQDGVRTTFQIPSMAAMYLPGVTSGEYFETQLASIGFIFVLWGTILTLAVFFRHFAAIHELCSLTRLA